MPLPRRVAGLQPEFRDVSSKYGDAKVPGIQAASFSHV